MHLGTILVEFSIPRSVTHEGLRRRVSTGVVNFSLMRSTASSATSIRNAGRAD